MRIIRALGFRLAIVAVVGVVMAVGWAVNSMMRYQARGDAQKTVSWFYDDVRYVNFAQFISSSSPDLEVAFSSLDRDDFANQFDGDGLLSPEHLVFKVDKITQQDNDGATAHVLVTGKIRPDEMKRGKTTYNFSDDTFEPFTHLVTLTKDGSSWYIAQVEPQN
jgi:hypothetical protein